MADRELTGLVHFGDRDRYSLFSADKLFMFNKYIGKFKKSEAEWVHEVLDMHGGDYEKSVQAIGGALDRLTKNAEPIPELEAFDKAIAASFFASRDWWAIGMERLAELGLVTMPTKS